MREVDVVLVYVGLVVRATIRVPADFVDSPQGRIRLKNTLEGNPIVHILEKK
jgi:hypothetical protein